MIMDDLIRLLKKQWPILHPLVCIRVKPEGRVEEYSMPVGEAINADGAVDALFPCTGGPALSTRWFLDQVEQSEIE
jgi:hypothetical protein